MSVGIAAGSGGQEDQVAGIDEDIVVVERAGDAVVGIVGEFGALDIDGEIIGRHLQDGDIAGDVEECTVIDLDAVGGADRNLAAFGNGLRAVLEVDGAAGDDFDAAFVLEIGEGAQIVELRAKPDGRILAAGGIGGDGICDQRRALGVAGEGTVGIGQDQRDALRPEGDAAVGIGG